MRSKEEIIARLREKIARCDSIMKRTLPLSQRISPIPSGAITGWSNRSKSLDRALSADNHRRAKAFEEYEAARKNKAKYEIRLEGILNETHHINGQRRKDSTTYKQHQNTLTQYAKWLRAFIQQGGKVCLSHNGKQLPVKRANIKTVTDSEGDRWGYDEITPMNEDGKIMSAEDVIRMYKDWISNQK